MILLIMGIVTLFIGSFVGYGGSYFYDKHFVSGNKITIQDVETGQQVLGNETALSVSVNPAVIGTVTPSPTTVTEKSEVNLSLPTVFPSIGVSPVNLPTNRASSQEINGFIERFAAQYGVDPHILRHIAVCESGFNPLAVNMHYAGLYQFSIDTWKSNRREMGEDDNPNLRFDAEEAVQTAAYMLSMGRRHAWSVC